jgi:hypothetical protein
MTITNFDSSHAPMVKVTIKHEQVSCHAPVRAARRFDVQWRGQAARGAAQEIAYVRRACNDTGIPTSSAQTGQKFHHKTGAGCAPHRSARGAQVSYAMRGARARRGRSFCADH